MFDYDMYLQQLEDEDLLSEYLEHRENDLVKNRMLDEFNRRMDSLDDARDSDEEEDPWPV